MNKNHFEQRNLIAIPNYKQLPYLKKLLSTLPPSRLYALMLIDNASRDGSAEWCKEFVEKNGGFFFEAEENMGAAGAWNFALDIAFEKSDFNNLLILNNDILLLPDTLKRIIWALNFEPYGLVSAHGTCGEFVDEAEFLTAKTNPKSDYHETPNFSCFGLSRKCFENVGLFDSQFFPAYFEDNDYHYRMKMKKIKAVCDYNNIFYHFGSRTKLSSPEFCNFIYNNFPVNQGKYIAKWGGEPGKELYTRAYNDEAKKSGRKASAAEPTSGEPALDFRPLK